MKAEGQAPGRVCGWWGRRGRKGRLGAAGGLFQDQRLATGVCVIRSRWIRSHLGNLSV